MASDNGARVGRPFALDILGSTLGRLFGAGTCVESRDLHRYEQDRHVCFEGYRIRYDTSFEVYHSYEHDRTKPNPSTASAGGVASDNGARVGRPIAGCGRGGGHVTRADPHHVQGYLAQKKQPPP